MSDSQMWIIVGHIWIASTHKQAKWIGFACLVISVILMIRGK